MKMSLTLVLGLSLVAGAPNAKAQNAKERPNVVIIFADDMGYADPEPFGGLARAATPNLNRMAREGRRFTNFHVAQPVCSASRTALLTGCYSNRLGIHGALGPKNTHGISESEVTIAQMLKKQGYSTGMAGKWHLGHQPRFLPTKHGFDEYFGLPYSNDMWPHRPEVKPGTYPNLPLIENDKVIDDDVTAEDQKTLTARYTGRAASFIKKHKDEPFFFYLAYAMPHVPLFTSDQYTGKTGNGTFADVIAEIDWSVGEVLKALDDAGVADRTLVIFTSDNGPWLNYGNHAGSAYPFREGKGTCWEGGVREPCLMRWPGKLAAGSSSDAMLMTIDLFPTLARLCGGTLPGHAIDGRDVWPLIAGEPGAVNPHDFYTFYYEQNQLQAVTTGDGQWKLQLPHTYRTLGGRPGGRDGKAARYEQVQIERPELYNLERDPSETTDVAAKHPEIVARLLAGAEQARVELGDSLTHREGRGVREPGRVEAAGE